MKNILFVMPILGLTGADRVIFTLLNNLDRTRFRPMLLLYKNDPSLNVLVKELRPDVEVTYLNISGRARFSFPKILTGIRRVCREKKCQHLVHQFRDIQCGYFTFLVPIRQASENNCARVELAEFV